MKIGEILALTQVEPLEKIATMKRLGMSKERARKALENAGCYFKKGVRGWHFDGDPAVLERSIFEFEEVDSAKREVAATVEKPRIEANTSKSDNASNGNSVVKAEIEALIMGKQDSKPPKVYKGIYFDSDIASFLDNIKHGNKSELVNKIIRQYLTENGLM